MLGEGFRQATQEIKKMTSDVKKQMTSAFGASKQGQETGDSTKSESKEHASVCSKCGENLVEGAKFCFSCGASISENDNESLHYSEEADSDTTKRKNVYEGKIHKCPNCGEVLGSFVTSCPSCGCEIRDGKNSSSVREFQSKLEQIEKSRPNKNKGILRSIYLNPLEIEETDQKIINLIRNFVIPNTKEDMLEFLILAASNIRISKTGLENVSKSEDAVSQAWNAKFEQAYNKARLSFSDSAEFLEVKAIYEQKNEEIIKSKKRKVRIITLVILGFILLAGGILALVLPLTISDSAQIKTENRRLNTIVEEVYDAIQSEDLVLAKAKATSLVFMGPESEEAEKTSEKWKKTREELLELIDSEEEKQK